MNPIIQRPQTQVSERGLTIFESLVALLLCVLLLWIVVPAGLMHFGLIESQHAATAESTGIADFDQARRAEGGAPAAAPEKVQAPELPAKPATPPARPQK